MSILTTNTKKQIKSKGDFATRVPKKKDFTEYIYVSADGTKNTVARTELRPEMDELMYEELKREVNNNRIQMEEHGAYAKTQEGQDFLYNMHQSEVGIEADVIKRIEMDELRKAMSKLPELQKEVIVKKFWYGMNNTNIAKQAGVSEGAIRDRLIRATKNLKELLEGKI